MSFLSVSTERNTTMKIITETKSLRESIARTLKTYTSVGARIHEQAVSAIWHGCKHGNPVLLNQLFVGLRPNDQQALRMYLNRAQIINGLEGGSPEGRSAEENQAAMLKGAVFGFSKGEFTIISGHTSEQAKSLLTLCEKRFINPNGKTDRKVLDRNNFAEVKTLGDTDILQQIVKIGKQLEGDTDTRKIAVSPSVRKMVEDMASKAESTLEQLALAS